MIKITLIKSDGCGHCAAVKKTIEKLKVDYPEITLEEIDMVSSEGMALVQKHHILSSPGILVNDEFFPWAAPLNRNSKRSGRNQGH